MDIEIEIWKSLSFMGYPNYMISNFGRVKSLNYKQTKKEKILKPISNGIGYLQVTLYKDGKRKKIYVHKLVANVFIPNDNPIEKTEINHLDENKENNHVDNLCWCNRYENINYGKRNERVSKKLKGKHCKPILQFTLDNIFIREWESITQVNKELNINQGNICNCCNGKYKQSGGFIWRYK